MTFVDSSVHTYIVHCVYVCFTCVCCMYVCKHPSVLHARVSVFICVLCVSVASI